MGAWLNWSPGLCTTGRRVRRLCLPRRHVGQPREAVGYSRSLLVQLSSSRAEAYTHQTMQGILTEEVFKQYRRRWPSITVHGNTWRSQERCVLRTTENSARPSSGIPCACLSDATPLANKSSMRRFLGRPGGLDSEYAHFSCDLRHL